MNYLLRKSSDRGYANHGWLESYHTFSFAQYHDPKYIQFRNLRVINEDFIDADQGFPEHPHNNMEIMTYVVEGAIAHKDSMGNVTTIKAGEVQLMSAGTGVMHSEFNPSQQEKTHMLQIWIVPGSMNTKPFYQQHNFLASAKVNELQMIVAPEDRSSNLVINSDAYVYRGEFTGDNNLTYGLDVNRHAWVQIIHGELTVNETQLSAGDGLAISHTSLINMSSSDTCEFLFFDLG